MLTAVSFPSLRFHMAFGMLLHSLHIGFRFVWICVLGFPLFYPLLLGFVCMSLLQRDIARSGMFPLRLFLMLGSLAVLWLALGFLPALIVGFRAIGSCLRSCAGIPPGFVLVSLFPRSVVSVRIHQ